MYLTSSTGLILYSSKRQKKKKGEEFTTMAEKCQPKQSHTLDPFSCSLYFPCGSSGTIWKKHACVSWVLSSRCSALSAPQTLDSEETLDQTGSFPSKRLWNPDTLGSTTPQPKKTGENVFIHPQETTRPECL